MAYLKLGLHGVVVEHHRRGPIGDLKGRRARHLPRGDIIITTIAALISFPACAPVPGRRRIASLVSFDRAC